MEDLDKVQSTVPNDGAKGVSNETALQQAKAEIRHIADYNKASTNAKQTRQDAENTTLCLWENQSADGLKHDTTEGAADPFDKALDTRVRYADMVLSEKVKIAVLALMKARIRVSGVENEDNAYAARLSTVARWLRDNQWGVDYLLNMTKWVRFAFGDSPAASLLEVHYRSESMLEMHSLTLSELGALYLKMVTAEMSEPEIMEQEEGLMASYDALQRQMADPLQDEALAAELLREFFPYITEGRAKIVIKEVRKQAQNGSADPVFRFPRPVIREEGPVLVPRRLYHDLFLPINTTSFKDARCYYIREWITEVELRKRIFSMDYSSKFVEKVLEKGEDASAFEWEGTSFYDNDKEAHRGEFEILTQYRMAVNDENIPGVYVLVFHNDCEIPALDEFLLDYPHGGYPGVLMAREVLSNRVLDSRSIGELAGPMQGVVKSFIDAAGNNANLNTLPSLAITGRRSTSRIKLGILEQNHLGRGGEVKPIQVGNYPAAALRGASELVTMYDEYFGRANTNIPDPVWQLETEWLVMWVLKHASDVWKMTLQYMQEYMPPEMMARIAGAKLGDAPKSRDEIRGSFDIKLEFDGRDFNFDFVKAKAELFKNWLMPMDTKATGQWELAMKSLLESVDPNLAEQIVVPQEQAQKNEAENEMQNIMRIAAGIPVELVDTNTPQNNQLRLQVLQQWAQMNAEEIQQWPENKQDMLEEHSKNLMQMVQQMENAQTGRTGV